MRIVSATLLSTLLGISACATEDQDDALLEGDDEVLAEDVSALVPATGRNDEVDGVLKFQNVMGSWGQELFCNPGTWARGFRLKVERGQHDGDDTALNAVELRCFKKTGGAVEALNTGEGPYGSWSPAWKHCPGNGNFFTGARMKIEPLLGVADDTGANDMEFACKNGGTVEQTNGMGWGEWTEWQFCPNNTFVCGATSKIYPSQGAHDDESMTGMQLRCCTL